MGRSESSNGNIGNNRGTCERSRIFKTAQILVGDFLEMNMKNLNCMIKTFTNSEKGYKMKLAVWTVTRGAGHLEKYGEILKADIFTLKNFR